MSSRTTAGDRLRRILAVLPWVAERPGITVDEVIERFGLTREDLLADLDVVFMVGVYPYTPDALVDVVIDEDDQIEVRLGEAFRRPLRLTPAQTLALLAAGSALLATPGTDPDGPLARGLAKLARSVGADPATTLKVDLGDTGTGSQRELLERALAEDRQVRLHYYTLGRDTAEERVVDPWLLRNETGHWYLSAYCHRAGAPRTFRLDRILDAEVLKHHRAHAAPGDALPSLRPEPSSPVVEVTVPDRFRWIAETYPVESVTELDGGMLAISLAVSGPAWLSRLMLRLGPDASMQGPEDLLAAARSAAGEVLARYERGGTP
ncbi:MAG: WYL domain-containing protein [Microthrixaceae bacterium]